MKQTIATTTIFKAVLAFTIIFSAFLVMAIAYNKAFKLKNESLSIIEKYEGVTLGTGGSVKSIKLINNYLSNSGYTTKGNCETGEFGVPDLNNAKYEIAIANKKYYYCLKSYCKNGICAISNNNKIFYKITFFYKFNLPFLGELVTFKITGETKQIQLYSTNQILK